MTAEFEPFAISEEYAADSKRMTVDLRLLRRNIVFSSKE
jgi:hypothetical protein